MSFRIGDGVFLMVVGGLTAVIMHSIHGTRWNYLVCMLLGMAATVLVQMLLAWAVSPLLGSIESMVPSMLVGMFSPMLICGLHLFGCEVAHSDAGALGAAAGLVVFVLLERYAAACRRALSQAAELTWG